MRIINERRRFRTRANEHMFETRACGHPWTHEISSEWMDCDYETTRDIDIETTPSIDVDGPWRAFFRVSFGNTIREFASDSI